MLIISGFVGGLVSTKKVEFENFHFLRIEVSYGPGKGIFLIRGVH